jgi:hypothetical protein
VIIPADCLWGNTRTPRCRQQYAIIHRDIRRTARITPMATKPAASELNLVLLSLFWELVIDVELTAVFDVVVATGVGTEMELSGGSVGSG